MFAFTFAVYIHVKHLFGGVAAQMATETYLIIENVNLLRMIKKYIKDTVHFKLYSYKIMCPQHKMSPYVLQVKRK